MSSWLEKQGLARKDLAGALREMESSIGTSKFRRRYYKAYNKGNGWYVGSYHDFLTMLINLMRNA